MHVILRGITPRPFPFQRWVKWIYPLHLSLRSKYFHDFLFLAILANLDVIYKKEVSNKHRCYE